MTWATLGNRPEVVPWVNLSDFPEGPAAMLGAEVEPRVHPSKIGGRLGSYTISTSSSDIAACFDELFAAAANLNCLPPPPFSSFSLLLFLLFLNELVIKLESASAFFVGGAIAATFIIRFSAVGIYGCYVAGAVKNGAPVDVAQLSSAALSDVEATYPVEFSAYLGRFLLARDQ